MKNKNDPLVLSIIYFACFYWTFFDNTLIKVNEGNDNRSWYTIACD